MNPRLLAIPLALCAVALVGTGCGPKVERVDVNTTIDLSGDWNDTDSRQTAEALIGDQYLVKWAETYAQQHGRKPVVKIGRITVRSNGDVIATDIFANDLVRTLVNRQMADAVAATAETDQARQERLEQEKHASATTRKENFQETGSDFLILGTINVQDDQSDGKKVKFYSVDLKMTEVQTQKQVWFGNHKIKKAVKR